MMDCAIRRNKNVRMLSLRQYKTEHTKSIYTLPLLKSAHNIYRISLTTTTTKSVKKRRYSSRKQTTNRNENFFRSGYISFLHP